MLLLTLYRCSDIKGLSDDSMIRQGNREMNEKMRIVPLLPEYDAAVAALVRVNLKARKLDIPGTAYYDEGLDHLSEYYSRPGRAYYVLLDGARAVGGIGYADFAHIPGCCEMQKLYLDDSVKGQGYGYELVSFIEARAREKEYKKIYLETHTNLQAAIHLYEKCGYRQIPRPDWVVHSTMNRFYLKDL
jgi:putative acetyltransferase